MESLPVEVFYNCIFPSLEYEDLLRLRRVSTSMKTFSDDFLRNNFNDKFRKIDNVYGFQFVLQANLPTTSIIIDCPTELFGSPECTQFLRLHGDKITHVTVHHLTSFISDLEFNFFSSLPNLQHLEIYFIDASPRDCSYFSTRIDRVKIPREKPRFPENFKNLKTLKLNCIQGSKVDDHGYGFVMLEFCENLEYFQHPRLDFNIPTRTKHADGCLGYVMDYIKRRSHRKSHLPNLRFYDMENICLTRRQHFNHYSSGAFFKLVKLCHKHQIKLLNVPAKLTGGSSTVFTSPTIVSMREVHRTTFVGELANLEKLLIRSLKTSSALQTGLGREAPDWPSLKSLDFKIDSPTICGDDDFSHWVPTQLFVGFLFGPGKQREGLKDLAIRFDTSYWENRDGVDEEEDDEDESIPVLNPLNVTLTCPFLTKLTLENWAGTDEQVTAFWGGLPLLEEIKLENCEKLRDAAFVGERGNENPAFLRLNKLKQLSLEGLDEMPGITDRSFELVFSRLKIKHFCLTSHRPLKSISKAGIEALLAGDFNKSVQKFTFDDWSLDGVSKEEFTQLKLKFRASHMI